VRADEGAAAPCTATTTFDIVYHLSASVFHVEQRTTLPTLKTILTATTVGGTVSVKSTS
jgi:hypothetical protein